MSDRSGRFITGLLLGLTIGVGCAGPEPSGPRVETPGPSSSVVTDRDLLIAFTGDQDVGPEARAVLALIRDEGADACIISGDLGYDFGADAWISMMEEVLPPDFPVFASIGNHDDDWPAYRNWLVTRAEGEWTGDYGIDSSHLFRGLFFVLSGAGTTGDDDEHAAYVQAAFAASGQAWKLLSMHKQMQAMQVGGKDDATGWPVFENAREAGAIIITAHEHSYHRTHVLSDMSDQIVVDDRSPYVLQPGQTFTAVSGLGGRSIRDQERCLPPVPPYGCNGEWAVIYTSDQSATWGALFLQFHVDGNPLKARGWFKNVDGDVVDEFELYQEGFVPTGIPAGP